MSLKQRFGFGLLFVVFCIFSSIIIYPLGAFDYAQPDSLVILFVAYSICGVFQYFYVRQHPAALGKWFQ